MRVTVSQWGNSLGIRIPKSVADDLDLRAGSTLSLDVRPGGYLMRLAQPKVSYLIEELAERMAGEEPAEEIEWDDPAGEEFW